MVTEAIFRHTELPPDIKRIKYMEYYLHDIPGRLRLKIPALKKNSQSACDIQQHKVNTMEAVTQAASKALLGFVLDRALQGTPLSIVTAFI